MLKILLLLPLLLLPISPINPTQVIISSYNQHNFDALYSYFSPTLQSKITADQFRSTMYDIYSRLGAIYDYYVISTGQLFCVHNLNLDTSIFKYNLTLQQQFDSFVISYSPMSTYKYLATKPQRTSLSFYTPKGSLEIGEKERLAVCSVYKITIVLEYARQSAEGDINPQTCVPLDYINRYWMKNVDNGHKSFLDTVTGNCAKLDDIVIGMIKFSSNANA